MGQESWKKARKRNAKPFRGELQRSKKDGMQRIEYLLLLHLLRSVGVGVGVRHCVALLSCHVFTRLNKDSHIDRKL